MENASGLSIVTAADLLAAQLPPRSDVLAPVLASDTAALVYGPSGIGKSFFALGVAWAVAAGGSFLGWQAPRPHRVLYVDGELGADGDRGRWPLRRRRRGEGHDGVPHHPPAGDRRPGGRACGGIRRAAGGLVAEAIARLRNGDVIVFDVDKRLLSAELSEAEIADRLRSWKAPQPRYKSGVFAKYASRVSSASAGAVTL